ncbi:hypothetical protein PFISCL1PPCAC_6761, partial [Pristionchus fissidentatus]
VSLHVKRRLRLAYSDKNDRRTVSTGLPFIIIAANVFLNSILAVTSLSASFALNLNFLKVIFDIKTEVEQLEQEVDFINDEVKEKRDRLNDLEKMISDVRVEMAELTKNVLEKTKELGNRRRFLSSLQEYHGSAVQKENRAIRSPQVTSIQLHSPIPQNERTVLNVPPPIDGQPVLFRCVNGEVAPINHVDPFSVLDPHRTVTSSYPLDNISSLAADLQKEFNNRGRDMLI